MCKSKSAKIEYNFSIEIRDIIENVCIGIISSHNDLSISARAVNQSSCHFESTVYSIAAVVCCTLVRSTACVVDQL